MLATGMDRDKRIRLFIDVGTNCEIVLSDGDTIVSTAAPAGPAFEGGAIRCGMRAADGAVEVVRIDPTTRACSLQVIGDVEPVGPVRLRARRRRLRAGPGRPARRAPAGSSPTSGPREIAPHVADRLTAIGQERVFVLHRPDAGRAAEESVYLSQRDVRELQFAKARDRHRLDAAARGARPRSSPTCSRCCWPARSAATSPPRPRSGSGWCPKIPVLRIVSAGNVAGEGAKMSLLSVRERAGALALLEEVTYVELSDRTDFNDRFIDLLAFPG